VEMPAPDEIDRLLTELKDDRRDVRSRAAYELGKHRDLRTVMPLIAALSDNDKFVRSWAAGALGKAGPPAVAPLLQVLDDPDAAIATAAALALAEIGDLRGVPLLTRALTEADWDVRPSAAAALASLGDADTLPDRVLSDPALSAADRLRILTAIADVAYTDDALQIRYRIPDLNEFCMDRSQAPDERLRGGAIQVLQALASSFEPPTGVSPAQGPESAAPPPGSDMASPEPSGRHPANDSPEPDAASASDGPRRSLWDKLRGR
jgi:HEAT repeat protein